MLWWVSVAPLGKPVVPEVYWMLIGSSGLSSACSRASSARSPPWPASTSASQSGVPISTTWRSCGQFGRTCVDHRRVVGGLEAGRRDQHRDAGLVEHELQLVRAVRRVDVDQDDADLGRGELHQRPLGHVRRPDADPVALAQPGREQAAGHRLDVLAQLGVGPAPPGLHLDQGLGVGLRGDRPVQVVADGVAEQRHVGECRRRRTGRRGRLRSRRRAFLRHRTWCWPHPAAFNQRPPPPDGEAGYLG